MNRFFKFVAIAMLGMTIVSCSVKENRYDLIP